jgi:hypothetical protein
MVSDESPLSSPSSATSMMITSTSTSTTSSSSSHSHSHSQSQHGYLKLIGEHFTHVLTPSATNPHSPPSLILGRKLSSITPDVFAYIQEIRMLMIELSKRISWKCCILNMSVLLRALQTREHSEYNVCIVCR